jgi:hypothetical protein
MRAVGYDAIEATRGMEALPRVKEQPDAEAKMKEMLRAQKEAGYGRYEVAGVLKDRGWAVGLAGTILYAIGYTTADLAAQFAGVYLLTVGAIVNLMQMDLNLPAREVLVALVDGLALTIEAAVNAVKAAGYALEEIADALKNAFGLGEDAVKDVLQAAGFVLDDILDALDDLFF